MPIWLAILSLANGFQQMKSGNRVGGAASMAGSFGNIVDSFKV